MNDYTPQQLVTCPKCEEEIHLTGETLKCACGEISSHKFKTKTAKKK